MVGCYGTEAAGLEYQASYPKSILPHKGGRDRGQSQPENKKTLWRSSLIVFIYVGRVLPYGASKTGNPLNCVRRNPPSYFGQKCARYIQNKSIVFKSSLCDTISSLHKPQVIIILYVLYSTVLLLPPLRFHCVGGFWDRTQDSCVFVIGSQTLQPLGYVSSTLHIIILVGISRRQVEKVELLECLWTCKQGCE